MVAINPTTGKPRKHSTFPTPPDLVETMKAMTWSETCRHYKIAGATLHRMVNELSPADRAIVSAAGSARNMAPKARSPIAVPPDFGMWCMIENSLQLCERYGRGTVTIRNWIEQLPESVQQARSAIMIERRDKAAITATATFNAQRAAGAVGVSYTKKGPGMTECDYAAVMRACNDAFTHKYQHAASRNGWRVWDVAA